MPALGNQGTGIQKSNFSFVEKLTKVSPYFQCFTFTIDGSLINSR
jgi:hypothetical protein